MTMKRQNPNRLDLDNTITRRRFIGTTAGTSAALLSGGLASFLRAAVDAADEIFIEKTIPSSKT